MTYRITPRYVKNWERKAKVILSIRMTAAERYGTTSFMEKVNWINGLSPDKKQKLIEKHKNYSKNRV